MNIKKMITGGPSSSFSQPLLHDLAKMEQDMLAVCPEAGQLNTGLARLLRAGGKRLRPLLAWTCWHLSGSRMEIVPLMTMLELMHTTSLIHDDFVDGAMTRRGVPTINAVEGGQMALRSGDYLLARAMEFLELYRGTGINEALSQVSQEMCLGELDQHAGLFTMDGMSAERYFERVRRKTALLMAESCRAGAIAGGADTLLADVLWDYGLHLGLAFQLRDDLMDWEPGAGTGKPPLQDLRSGVITLPLIFAAENGGPQLRDAATRREKTEEDISLILAWIHKTNAKKKTYDILKRECEGAVSALSPLPSSAERNSLMLLAKSISEVKFSG